MWADVALRVVLPLLNGFVVELMACAAMFVHGAPRRRRFAVRVALCAAGLVGVAVLTHYRVGVVPYAMISSTVPWAATPAMALRFVLLYACLYAAIRRCFDIGRWQAVFVVVAAVSLQHAVYCATRLLTTWPPRAWSASTRWDESLAFLAVSAALLAVGYVLFARPLHGTLERYGGSPRLVMVFVGVMLCVDVFSCQLDYYAGLGEVSSGAYALTMLTRMLMCVFVLVLLDDIVNRELAERDDAMLRGMLRQQRSQLESDKVTIDLINVKAHDIKRQLSLLGNRISQDEIDELSRTVGLYDASAHTGNEALDVLLTNRALVCGQHGIAFERVVDGTALGFMRPTDVYALVGNAVDNAIEAVERLDGGAERYVRLTVRRDRGMALIHVENPFAGQVRFVDGLPRTSKDDTRNHGFGTRSMRMIAQRYGGAMTMTAQRGVFLVNIVLPLR